MDPKQTLAYEIRLKNPGRGLEADYKNGRSSAIELFCLECMGGSVQTVGLCKSYSCPLWRFRPGTGTKVRPNGFVPSQEEYCAKLDEKNTPEKVAQGKKLAELRKNNKEL